MGDRETYIVTPSTGEQITYSYQQRSLSNFDLSGNHVLLALSASNDGRSCDIGLLDEVVRISTEFSTSHKVISASYYEYRIALLDSGTIYGYSQTGEETGSWDAGGDAQKIVLYSRDRAYVLGIRDVYKSKVTLPWKDSQKRPRQRNPFGPRQIPKLGTAGPARRHPVRR